MDPLVYDHNEEVVIFSKVISCTIYLVFGLLTPSVVLELKIAPKGTFVGCSYEYSVICFCIVFESCALLVLFAGFLLVGRR